VPQIKSNSNKSNRGGARPGAGRPKAAAYEAAEFSRNRGLIFLNTVDPKREAPPQTRIELLKKSRWLYNNLGVASYLIEHLAQRAVGTGIRPKPTTANAEWNRLAERAFLDRACAEAWSFDSSAQVNFFGAQSLIIRQVAVDGDFFAQFLKTDAGAARVRFLGGETVGSTADSSERAFDGVLLDKYGAPVSFRVITDRSAGKYEDVPASDILHFRHVRRSGYPRGVSWLHNAIVNCHDLLEYLAYEKGSAKAGAQIAFAITSNEAVRLGGGLSSIQSGDAVPQDITTETLYNGTLIPKLRPGESIQSFKNEHPGTSFEPFINTIMGEIARGIGLPPEAIMLTTGAAGTEFRGILEIAQNFLERLQQMLVDQFCRPFWKYWLWHEMQSGRLPYPGEDWWRCSFRAPKKITVDNGRDGRLYAQLLDSGYMSWEYYCDIHGIDSVETEDAIISGYLRRQEKCASLGLNPADVFPSHEVAASAPAQQAGEQSAGMDMQMKEKLDAIGAAVRAGVITPSVEVEESVRALTGLPAMGDAVLSEWSENPIRSPITLTNELAAPDQTQAVLQDEAAQV
jgi:capsid protein